MGTNTLTDKSPGDVVLSSDPNSIHQATSGDFVPRDPVGTSHAPLDLGGNLGTALFRWDSLFIKSIDIDGKLVDDTLLVSDRNVTISSTTRTTSALPDFIRADGAILEFTLLAGGLNPDLVMNINGSQVSYSADIVESGLTAAPAINNTCLVDDTSLSGTPDSRYAGEDGGSITIDTAGTEITSRIGQYCAFQNGATSDYFIAYIESATSLTNVFRGFFFDSSGNPSVRQPLSDNDTLTLMNLGWVFAFDAPASLDVSYRSPIYSYDAPASPAVGDYWYDLNNEEWNRWGGSSWSPNGTTLLGLIVNNTTACVASRCFDPRAFYKSDNNISLEKESDDIVRTVSPFNSSVNVYGREIDFKFDHIRWEMPTDLESPQIELPDTTYYVYITEDGDKLLSDIRPYQRRDLEGDYHPYESWRSVGSVKNDASSNFTGVRSGLPQVGSWILLKSFDRPTIPGTYQFVIPDIDDEYKIYKLVGAHPRRLSNDNGATYLDNTTTPGLTDYRYRNGTGSVVSNTTFWSLPFGLATNTTPVYVFYNLRSEGGSPTSNDSKIFGTWAHPSALLNFTSYVGAAVFAPATVFTPGQLKINAIECQIALQDEGFGGSGIVSPGKVLFYGLKDEI